MMVPVITSNWSYSPSSLFLRLESCSWLRGTIHKCCWFSFNPVYWHLHGAPGSSASFHLGFYMYYNVQSGPSIMLFCYALFSWYNRASSGSMHWKTTTLMVLAECQKNCLINFCFYKLSLWSFGVSFRTLMSWK